MANGLMLKSASVLGALVSFALVAASFQIS
jgi:hypothetical protein